MCFRSKNIIVFKCSSIAKHDLITLWMNSNTALLFMTLFSRQKRSNLDSNQWNDSLAFKFVEKTYSNSNFDATFGIVHWHFHLIWNIHVKNNIFELNQLDRIRKTCLVWLFLYQKVYFDRIDIQSMRINGKYDEKLLHFDRSNQQLVIIALIGNTFFSNVSGILVLE